MGIEQLTGVSNQAIEYASGKERGHASPGAASWSDAQFDMWRCTTRVSHWTFRTWHKVERSSGKDGARSYCHPHPHPHSHRNRRKFRVATVKTCGRGNRDLYVLVSRHSMLCNALVFRIDSTPDGWLRNSLIGKALPLPSL